MGRGQTHIVGCPRGGASIFLILEVTIIEITGIDASREMDPQTGLKLLKIRNSKS
jgi:predicted DNA-binding protein with PD1-like motif